MLASAGIGITRNTGTWSFGSEAGSDMSEIRDLGLFKAVDRAGATQAESCIFDCASRRTRHPVDDSGRDQHKPRAASVGEVVAGPRRLSADCAAGAGEARSA
jgi:hypothetical protein